MNVEILKIIGVAFVTAFSAILLKSTKPELSFAVTVTGVIILLIFIVDALQNTILLFQDIALSTGVDNALIKILLKIVGVGYVAEFASGILTDFGSTAVADKVALAGKLTIILLSFPIFQGLLQLIKGFIQLV